MSRGDTDGEIVDFLYNPGIHLKTRKVILLRMLH